MKHVTILGRAGRPYTPLPVGEVWGVNGRPRTVEEWDRLTRQFQLHPFQYLTDWERWALEHVRVPTYVIRPSRRYPHTLAYPLQVVPAGAPLASSFDYMFALALWEGFTSILVTGLDFRRGTLRERLCEQVSCAYWIGLARGRGVAVALASPALAFPWRYGFDYCRERRWGQAVARAARAETHLDDGAATMPRRVKGIVASGRLPKKS